MAAGKVKKQARAKVSAYDLYGRAFQELHKRHYKKALDLFDKILSTFPDETEVLARVNSLRRVCVRALQKEVSVARSAESLFDLGVYHHNNGDHKEASSHFREALKLAGEDSDYIYYAMAAGKAQQGDLEEAVQDLKQATEMNQDNCFFARNDPDFTSLAGNDDFRRLLGIKS